MALFTNHIYGTIMQVIYHLQNRYNFPQACHLFIARIYHPPYNKQVWNKFQVILWSTLQMTCRSLSTGMLVKRRREGPDWQQDNFAMLKMVRNLCLAMFKTNIKKHCMTDHCRWVLVTFGLVACTLYVLELQWITLHVVWLYIWPSIPQPSHPNWCYSKESPHSMQQKIQTCAFARMQLLMAFMRYKLSHRGQTLK